MLRYTSTIFIKAILENLQETYKESRENLAGLCSQLRYIFHEKIIFSRMIKNSFGYSTFRFRETDKTASEIGLK